MGLRSLVYDRAMAAAEDVAIVDVARSWTYGEVADQVGRTAAALMHAEVRPGDRVGVHFNKSADGFIAMHAVVSIGAVAVPLDPASPATRLARICKELDISVVLSHAPRRKTIEALHDLQYLRAVIGLDADLSSAKAITPAEVNNFESRPPTPSGDDSLAYIVTTSGSTGEPKGICHTHASGLAYAEMSVRTFDIRSVDRISDISPYHFDISTFSLWATPLAGATNIIINEAYQRLPASHSQLLADEAVSIWYSVPFLLQQLVVRGDLTNRNLDALRWVQFAGEVAPPAMIAKMMSYCPNARFANSFGPAEVNVCTMAVFDSPPQTDEPLSIGFPVDRTQVRVTHQTAESPIAEHEVAGSEVGEMWVATPQLMTGYWNRDETNALVTKTVDGDRYYRTGDLVSRTETGEFSFHGRVDHQVKVRVFRIELGGIETLLESVVHTSQTAENVVVAVLRSSTGEDELIAGILGATSAFSSSDFLSAAASVLPAYAVPTRTALISEPAFTGSGKLDRRVLRASTIEEVRDEK